MKLFNSHIEDLTQNKDNQNFWSYLRSLKEEQNSPSYTQDIPVDNLFQHFKRLHSRPDLSTLPSGEMTFKKHFSALGQTKDVYNVLDRPFTLVEIKNMVKLPAETQKGPWA